MKHFKKLFFLIRLFFFLFFKKDYNALKNSRVVIINVKGGIGNQLYYYGLYLKIKMLSVNHISVYNDSYLLAALEDNHGCTIDESFSLESIFTFDKYLEQFAPSINNFLKKSKKRIAIFIKLLLCHTIDEHEFNQLNITSIDDSLQNIMKNHKKILFDGYWQGSGFVEQNNEKLITSNDIFILNKLSEDNKLIFDEILQSNSASMHIRRGDYLNNQDIYNIIDDTYYETAVNLLLKKNPMLKFYIFSDDLNAAENIANHLGLINYRIVSGNTGKDSYIDLILMTKCQFNIISNSTFSWWAAYLNEFPNKIVFAPKNYYTSNYNKSELGKLFNKYFYPDTWILI